MDSGLLWYDDDPQQTLEAKVSRAAQRYREKYGRLPDTCYVHPRAVADRPAAELNVECPPAAAPAPAAPGLPAGRHGAARDKGAPPARAARATGAGTIRVRAAPYMLRNHFWLGESGDDGADHGLN